MRLVRLSSAKSGATAAGRRVLASVTATTEIPTAADEGVPLAGGPGFWAEAVVGGTDDPSFSVTFWIYSYTALRWFPWSTTGFSETWRDRWTLPGGPSRIYPQVTAVSGTNPTLDMWIVEWFES